MFFTMISVLLAIPLFLVTPLVSERIYVGAQQEKWQFPSDHLPIGVSVIDRNRTCRVVSWNVLNFAYMKWIYEDSQGLAKSSLTKEDVPIKENGLTLREQHVIDLLLSMIQSADVLCLQECSERFIQELQSQIPFHMKIVRSSDAAVRNQNVILYDGNFFELMEKNLHMGVFASEPSRPLMEVVFENRGVRTRIFNVHLRCDALMPQRFELAQFVSLRKKQDEITLVLGDLNVGQKEMNEAFASVNPSHGFKSFDFYKTTISPELESKKIDHIFFDVGDNILKIRENSADEGFVGLQEMVDLLNNKHL